MELKHFDLSLVSHTKLNSNASFTIADVISAALRTLYSATSRHTPQSLLTNITDLVTSCASRDSWPAFQLCEPCATCATLSVMFLNSIISITPSHRHSGINPRLSGFYLFSCRTSRIHRIRSITHISSDNRAVGDDRAWETLLASGAIRHIHRRSPRRVCCTSTQATLRDLALYVSCGTSFRSCNQAFRHVDYLFLITSSACRVSAVCSKRATHSLPAIQAPVYCGCPCRDPLGCPPMPRQDGIGDKAPTLICCTAALLLRC